METTHMTLEQIHQLKHQTEEDILQSVAYLVAKFVEASGGFQIKSVSIDVVSAHKLDGSKPRHYVANAKIELDL